MHNDNKRLIPIHRVFLLVAFCSLIITLFGISKETNLIEALEIEKNSIKVRPNEQFRDAYLRTDFFARYGDDIDLTQMDYSITTIPFVLNVISIVWISGKTYFIDSMDKDLYWALENIKKVFQRMYPKTLWEGALIPRRLVNNRPRKSLTNRYGLLFSGGLDSTSSALAHSDKNLLLITIRGVWDVPLDMDELWQERKREFEEFAAAYGHENAYIASNFSPFLKWEILNNLSSEISSWRADTAEGLGMFGLAAPLMYAKGIPLLFMASSFEWSFPWPSAGTPLVDDHLMFAGGHAFKNDQFHMTRLDKLQFVAQRIRQGAPRPKIKVCEGQSSGNSLDLDCAKCIPMAFSLLALSEDPRPYGFDASDDQIISAMKQYLLLPQKYWTLWELSFVQDYLRQQPSQDPRLSWFATYNLGSAIDYELEKSKQMVHWGAFSDIAPKGLTIPHYSWRLLDVQKEEEA